MNSCMNGTEQLFQGSIPPKQIYPIPVSCLLSDPHSYSLLLSTLPLLTVRGEGNHGGCTQERDGRRRRQCVAPVMMEDEGSAIKIPLPFHLYEVTLGHSRCWPRRRLRRSRCRWYWDGLTCVVGRAGARLGHGCSAPQECWWQICRGSLFMLQVCLIQTHSLFVQMLWYKDGYA
jgi:hypothetical protein